MNNSFVWKKITLSIPLYNNQSIILEELIGASEIICITGRIILYTCDANNDIVQSNIINTYTPDIKWWSMSYVDIDYRIGKVTFFNQHGSDAGNATLTKIKYR